MNNDFPFKYDSNSSAIIIDMLSLEKKIIIKNVFFFNEIIHYLSPCNQFSSDTIKVNDVK